MLRQPLGAGEVLAVASRMKKDAMGLVHMPSLTDLLGLQVLAVASRMKKDAMRLVHMPSLTVFSNWPTSRWVGNGSSDSWPETSLEVLNKPVSWLKPLWGVLSKPGSRLRIILDWVMEEA